MLPILLRRCEFVRPKPYRGHGEVAIAVLGCLLWFFAILIRQSLPETGSWTMSENLIEALSFVGFAALPIFFLATQPGERFAQAVLLPRHGLGFQLMLCGGLAVYLILGQGLSLNPEHFPWVGQMEDLIIPDQRWLNNGLFLGGVFVAMRVPFLMLELRRHVSRKKLYSNPFWAIPFGFYGQLALCLTLNTLYILTLHTSFPGHPVTNPWEGYGVSLAYLGVCGVMALPWNKAQARDRLTIPDFFLIILCVAILYWFSVPSFRFGVFMGVDLFIVVLIYGTGLGREHFGYSFQLRSLDLRVLSQQTVVAALLLIPLALLAGFVQPQTVAHSFSIWRLVSFFLLFTFRVGIFEEVFFRSGLMVWFRDQLLSRGRDRLPPQALLLLCALLCSVLFGIAHIGNEPGLESPLSPWQYKWIYVGLASVASMFYAVTFGETNRLSGPILIHGFVDTAAVILLGGFLAVPF